jgi:hypothetical protein
MYLKSHKWIDVPFTSYERKRELRVRESVHTVMLFDKQYQDIDTGKFDLDKMPIINSYSLAHAIDGNDSYKHGRLDRDYEDTNIYDFLRALKKKVRDEKTKEKREKANLERAKEEKILSIQREIEDKERAEFHAKRQKEWLANRVAADNALEATLQRLSPTYSKVEDERIYLGGDNHGQRIIISKWDR